MDPECAERGERRTAHEGFLFGFLCAKDSFFFFFFFFSRCGVEVRCGFEVENLRGLICGMMS